MAQVAEYKIGNSTVRIFDDACAKTEAEVDLVLRRIGRAAQKALNECGYNVKVTVKRRSAPSKATGSSN